MSLKPAIAVIIPGGIGAVDNIPVLLDLLKRFTAAFDVTIYSLSTQELHTSLEAVPCTVIFVPRLIKFNLIKMFYLIWRIRRDHGQKQFVLVHGFWIMLQGVITVISGKMLNIPSMITLPGGDVTYIPSIHYGSLSNPINKFLAAWCVRHASRIVLLTRFQQAIMHAHGIAGNNISIIPYGVDVTRFTYHPHSFSQPLQLIYLGNLNRVKDPFTLIKTFYILSQNHECRLRIIGSDILKGKVQAYARGLGVYDTIRWEGKQGYDKIPSVLSTADILLLTSLYEGQGVVVLEAFASGVLVAGTNVGLLADIGENTMTTSPGNADGLANCIEEMIQHPEQVDLLHSKNRNYAETFSAEWTFKEYMKLYDELIAQDQY